MDIVRGALENPTDDLPLLIALTKFVRNASASQNWKVLITECVNSGFTPKLVALLQINSEAIKVNVAWSLANIATIPDTVMNILIPLNVHIKMLKLLKISSNKLKEQCLWVLANIAGDCVEARDELIKIGVIDELTAILSKNVVSIHVLENSTWLISNLCKDKPIPPLNKVI